MASERVIGSSAGWLRQMVWFGLGGTLGFVVDAGVLWLLGVLAGWNPYLARLVSFLCAVATTLEFNRRWTFATADSKPALKRAGQYLLAMSFGFAVNYGVYAALVYRFSLQRSGLVLAVAAGSLAGFAVNFLAARLWVFGRSR